jgi:hypothetical protein
MMRASWRCVRGWAVAWCGRNLSVIRAAASGASGIHCVVFRLTAWQHCDVGKLEPWTRQIRRDLGEKMFIAVRGGLTAATLVCLSACSSLITGGDLIRPGEATGVIEVINQTSNVVDVVLISECNASTYGLNRMPDGVGIGTGQSYQFTVSAGCWDVDAGSFGVGEARQRMTVSAGGLTSYTVHD